MPSNLTTPSPSTPAFLDGGGEMGRFLREYGWGASPIGMPAQWPQGLRIAVHLMLNAGHPMYIFWGPELLCFYNDAYRPSLGPERHPDSLAQPAHEVWAEIWDSLHPQLAQVMSGQGAFWAENQCFPTTREGVHEDVYWTYSHGPINDDSAPHGVGGVLTICNETTGQVNLAKELSSTQERLQLALSGGRGIGTWDWDVQADCITADAHFAQLYGVEPERARQGVSLQEFFAGIHPQDRERLQHRIAEALRTGDLFYEEYRLVDANGRVRWVMAQGKCQLSETGLPLRFPGISFDISDRKILAERLHELNRNLEHKLLERMLERGRTWHISPEILGVLNTQGYFEASNPAWEAILGWNEEEVASKIFLDLIHPDDLAESQRLWGEATQNHIESQPYENRYLHKNGSYRWLSWVGVLESDKLYCSARDITQDKERAHALLTAESALRQSQKMEAVGQLTGGLAHDFNNLLGAISGSVEIAEFHMSNGELDKAERFMQTAHDSISRAAALTHRLLAFSRRQTLAPQLVNMHWLVTDMEELIRHTVGPLISVEVIGALGLWSTLVDISQLENVLLNLCINARDAMPDGGRLTIETTNLWLDEHAAQERELDPGAYASLCVTDTGVGMSPDIVAKVFDPFFTTKPLGYGTGLGLSMVHGFARQSGGSVKIQSAVEQGTTLCIYLPRHTQDAAPEDKAEPPAVQERGSGQVILVIDDEPVIRMVVVELLQEFGYVVLEAADGPSGLHILQQAGQIDLLITDVGLPHGMNGRQLADAARISRPDLKVLFITGYAENAVVGNAHVEKWMTVVTKPFDIDLLTRRVKDMLAQP